ncbi:hypothetical protein ACS0TY_013156 [Phlomoides rotata]
MPSCRRARNPYRDARPPHNAKHHRHRLNHCPLLPDHAQHAPSPPPGSSLRSRPSDLVAVSPPPPLHLFCRISFPYFIVAAFDVGDIPLSVAQVLVLFLKLLVNSIAIFIKVGS